MAFLACARYFYLKVSIFGLSLALKAQSFFPQFVTTQITVFCQSAFSESKCKQGLLLYWCKKQCLLFPFCISGIEIKIALTFFYGSIVFSPPQRAEVSTVPLTHFWPLPLPKCNRPLPQADTLRLLALQIPEFRYNRNSPSFGQSVKRCFLC